MRGFLPIAIEDEEVLVALILPVVDVDRQRILEAGESIVLGDAGQFSDDGSQVAMDRGATENIGDFGSGASIKQGRGLSKDQQLASCFDECCQKLKG